MDSKELEEYQFQLAAVNEALESDPTSESLITLKAELTDLIELLVEISKGSNRSLRTEPEKPSNRGDNTRITPVSKETSVDIPPAPAPPAPAHSLSPSPPPPPTGDNEAIPPPPPPSGPPSPPPPPPEVMTDSKNYTTGSIVMARWISGDKQYYKARITGITGSSVHPMYTVKFLDHGVSDTVPLSCVKPLSSEPIKRKISEVDTEKVAEISMPLEKIPVKNSKTQQKKALDQNKMKWQQFANRGIKGSKFSKTMKLGEKSMFRSPDEVSGRVGIVNSGKPMTKDIKRSRHVYQTDQERHE
ncbi:hypothetical protein V1511DRAFT_522091 [Dipodascopsis uninucleata]